MEYSHGRFAFSLTLIPQVAFWILSSGATVVQAQDARVAIEPRVDPGTSSTGSANRAASFRIDAYTVMIPVLVTDRHGRLVTGLEKGQFRVYEDKVEQVITHFASEDLPISVVLVFDCSASMGAKLQKARRAAADFLSTANSEDEFAVITFSEKPQLVVGLTTDINDVQNRLMFTTSEGRTALLDAVYLAMDQLRHAKHSRKAILIISDGGDNCSRYTMREVRDRVREADVQIYSIAVMEPWTGRERTLEELAGPALLDEIADQSGGRMYEVYDPSDMPKTAAKIGEALRSQYVLGYSPAISKLDGKYHRLKVKLDLDGLKGRAALRPFFRPGYIAPAH